MAPINSDAGKVVAAAASAALGAEGGDGEGEIFARLKRRFLAFVEPGPLAPLVDERLVDVRIAVDDL